MNKFLRYSLSLVLAFVAGFSYAQEVTLDFTDNSTWKLPEDKANAKKDAADFTNGTYTITVAAPTAYYWLSSNTALFYGKEGGHSYIA